MRLDLRVEQSLAKEFHKFPAWYMFGKVRRLVKSAFCMQNECAVHEPCRETSRQLIETIATAVRTGILEIRVYQAINLVCSDDEWLHHLHRAARENKQ